METETQPKVEAEADIFVVNRDRLLTLQLSRRLSNLIS